ncbi:hypothetical protein CVV38_03360 [Candidatus Peregrinibacteria bacterium HGW-Peregrinibacteria-1]|jgi:hypothetical protein|nr:MAG: hypothetical protein CVV38_03360 [Candidatus Peregrinibacteria bacterium HGW-Peregrinibacteria-1]
MNEINKKISIVSHTYLYLWLESLKEIMDVTNIDSIELKKIAQDCLEKALENLNNGKLKDYKESIVHNGAQYKNSINHLLQANLQEAIIQAIKKDSADKNDSTFWN